LAADEMESHALMQESAKKHPMAEQVFQESIEDINRVLDEIQELQQSRMKKLLSEYQPIAESEKKKAAKKAKYWRKIYQIKGKKKKLARERRARMGIPPKEYSHPLDQGFGVYFPDILKENGITSDHYHYEWIMDYGSLIWHNPSIPWDKKRWMFNMVCKSFDESAKFENMSEAEKEADRLYRIEQEKRAEQARIEKGFKIHEQEEEEVKPKKKKKNLIPPKRRKEMMAEA
jgi:hypothetical protein